MAREVWEFIELPGGFGPCRFRNRQEAEAYIRPNKIGGCLRRLGGVLGEAEHFHYAATADAAGPTAGERKKLR